MTAISPLRVMEQSPNNRADSLQRMRATQRLAPAIFGQHVRKPFVIGFRLAFVPAHADTVRIYSIGDQQWSCLKSWKSSPMPPSTTRPAQAVARQSGHRVDLKGSGPARAREFATVSRRTGDVYRCLKF